TAIGFSQDKPVEVPKILVKIALGETVTFKKATVKFLKVVEDSRCPSDVNCIWEGQAIVLVEVAETGKETQQLELRYGKRINKRILSSEGYSLKGMSLSPYPSSTNIDKMDYVLLVSEEGN
ncbi:MAG: hypothetical protein ACI884_002468, partial [Ulvibacter sp.]